MELPQSGDLLLGKYLLEKRIGEGGMGVVYAARHELLGQRVAVKLIHPEYAVRVEAVGRFLNEARAAARIDNEHVARVLDVGMLDGGLPYMVLEYLDGTDLSKTLELRGPLPVADVADYLLQSIEAIAHAHAAGIVHRDLKPSNIFLARRPDGTSRVKVLDFGISKITGGLGDGPIAKDITRTDSMLGSPAYMSPEQLRDAKNVDHRSDIWALGVVAYELLTTRLPFSANNAVALFAAIQESAPTSVRAWRPDVSAELDAIVMKCLRRLPEERFASVTELACALAPFGTSVAATAYASSNRILPISAPSGSSLESSSHPAREAAAQVILEDEKADMPISSTLPGLPPLQPLAAQVASNASSRAVAEPQNRVARALGIGIGVVATVAIIGLMIPRLWSIRRPDNSASVATTTTTTASPLNSASPEPTPAPEPAPTPTPPTHTSDVLAARTGAIVMTAPIPQPATSATTHPKPRTTPSAASCNPPFDFDKQGSKIWKRECL